MKKGVPDIDTVFAVIMKVAGSFYSLFVCRSDSWLWHNLTEVGR